MQELNKEMILTADAIDTLVEEMAEREEMGCKGDAKAINICFIN